MMIIVMGGRMREGCGRGEGGGEGSWGGGCALATPYSYVHEKDGEPLTLSGLGTKCCPTFSQNNRL